MKFSNYRTDRIDTTVTEVAVRRGNGSVYGAAARYVLGQFPNADILAIFSLNKRGDGGDPVYGVEWIEKGDE